MSRDKEVYEPKPFGVDYVPQKRRLKTKHGGWVHVGYASEISVGKAKSVDFENVKVAIFNIEGTYYAVKDACPHAQYPVAKGSLKDAIVSCSSHNWRFDVTNGACTKAEHGMDVSQIVLRTFQVDIRGDEIWVK